MPKVKMPLTSMTDVDVEYVSLVHRPASRLPFKVMKSVDKGAPIMFKNLLSRTAKSDTTNESKAVIAAVVVPVKKADAAREALSKMGLVVDDMTEADGKAVFHQIKSDDVINEDDMVAIDAGSDMLVVVDNVKKSFNVYQESNSFAANVATTGFFPGLYTACEALLDTIRTNLHDSGDLDEAKTMLTVVVQDFADYVMGMVNQLPTEVFKMDGAALADTPEEEQEGDVPVADDPTTEDSAGDTPPVVEGSEEEEPDTKDEDTTDGLAHVVKQQLTDLLKDALGDVKQSMQDLESRVSERMDSLELVAKSADAAVKKTVLSRSLPASEESNTKKSEPAQDPWANTSLDILDKHTSTFE